MKNTVKSLIIASSISLAQAETFILDFQYSPSLGIYEEQIGVGFYYYNLNSTGFYLNLSTSRGDPDEYYSNDDLDISGPNYAVLDTSSYVTIFNIGATRQFNDWLYLYAGLGIAGTEVYTDSALRIGNTVLTYDNIRDSSEDETSLNVNFGTHIIVKEVAINLGFNSFTASPVIGIGYNF